MGWQAIASLRVALAALQSRGLPQRSGRRYDLHPVVRGYAFDQLEYTERQHTFDRIRDHFANLPPEKVDKATELGDLKNSLQIFHALIGAEKFGEAVAFYGGDMSQALLLSLEAYPTVLELLRPLFPEGWDHPPALVSSVAQGYILSDAGIALSMTGRYMDALATRRTGIRIALTAGRGNHLAITLRAYGISKRDLNHLAEALHAIQLALEVAQAQVVRDEKNITYTRLALMWQYLYRGEWLFSHGRLDEAADVWHTVIAMAQQAGIPVVDTQAHLARVLATAGQQTEARRLLETVLEHTPSGALHCPHCVVAETYMRLGDRKQARAHALHAYRHAWADGPPHAWWWALKRTRAVLAELGEPEPV